MKEFTNIIGENMMWNIGMKSTKGSYSYGDQNSSEIFGSESSMTTEVKDSDNAAQWVLK